jgi:hypothetical protein
MSKLEHVRAGPHIYTYRHTHTTYRYVTDNLLNYWEVLAACLMFVAATRILPYHELTAQNRIKLTETENATDSSILNCETWGVSPDLPYFRDDYIST